MWQAARFDDIQEIMSLASSVSLDSKDSQGRTGYNPISCSASILYSADQTNDIYFLVCFVFLLIFL